MQRFGQWSPSRAEKAAGLIRYAQRRGAAAIALCTVNDPTFRPDGATRLAGLREAFAGLAPMLREACLIGRVEPSGFAECALRSKREVVEAIDAVGAADVFRLKHDMFHHHVAGEPVLFPEQIRTLLAGGYAGSISPERFAPSVAALESPTVSIEASLSDMQTEHNKKAA